LLPRYWGNSGTSQVGRRADGPGAARPPHALPQAATLLQRFLRQAGRHSAAPEFRSRQNVAFIRSNKKINFIVFRMAKIDSFGSETGEAVSHWIANEQAIFRLFGKIQLALKFGGDTKSTSGAELLKAIFVKALEAHKSVPLCSSFALEEILNVPPSN
jgi:hypothetical protein